MTHMTTCTGKTLNEISTLVAVGDATAVEAIATLNERLANAKPGSGKAKRTSSAIAQLTAGASLDVKAAFAAARGVAKAKPAKKAAKAAKPAKKAAKAAPVGLEGLVGEMSREELVQLVLAKLAD